VAVARAADADAVEQLCALALQFRATGYVSCAGTPVVACQVCALPVAEGVVHALSAPRGLAGRAVPYRDESLLVALVEWRGAAPGPAVVAPDQLLVALDDGQAFSARVHNARIDITRTRRATGAHVEWELDARVRWEQ
jgi:hypothetical protein